MKITLEQYIQNPMGKKSMVMSASAREAIKNDYTKKYDAILLRERGNIDYYLYEDKKNNRYYAHFKIPSEVVPKFYYDVVFEFYADENVKNTEDLMSYNIRFFSNDPAFAYTYAHAMIAEDLFVDFLKPKMSTKAVKKDAVEKNPRGEIGYVKSLYFAYLTFKHKGLNRRNVFTANAKKFSKLHILGEVEHADKKISSRQTEGEKVAKQKRAEKDRAKKQTIGKPKEDKPSGAIGKVKSIGSIKPTGNIRNTKKVNRK